MKNFSFFKPFAILCVFFAWQNELFGGLGCSGGDCRDRRSTPTPVNRGSRREIADFTGRMPAPRVQAPPQRSSSSFSTSVPGIPAHQPPQIIPFTPNSRPKPQDEREADMEENRRKQLYVDTLFSDLNHPPSIASELDALDAQQRVEVGSPAQDRYFDNLVNNPNIKKRAARKRLEAKSVADDVELFGVDRAGTPETQKGYPDPEDAFGFTRRIGRGLVDGVDLDLANPATQMKYDPEAALVRLRSLSPEPPTKSALKPKSQLSPLPPFSLSAPSGGFTDINARFGGVNPPQSSGPSARYAAILNGSDQSDPFNPPQKDQLRLSDVDEEP